MQSRPPIDTHAAVAVAATPEGAPALPPRVSWGAIIAGAVVALAIGLMLNTLGVAVGATAVDAVGRDTPSATTFGIGAGLWLLVSNLIGLAVGGYVAGRLSGTADNTDAILHGRPSRTWGALHWPAERKDGPIARRWRGLSQGWPVPIRRTPRFWTVSAASMFSRTRSIAGLPTFSVPLLRKPQLAALGHTTAKGKQFSAEQVKRLVGRG